MLSKSLGIRVAGLLELQYNGGLCGAHSASKITSVTDTYQFNYIYVGHSPADGLCMDTPCTPVTPP